MFYFIFFETTGFGVDMGLSLSKVLLVGCRQPVSVLAGFTVNLHLQGSPVLTSVEIIQFLPAVAFLYAWLTCCVKNKSHLAPQILYSPLGVLLQAKLEPEE